MISRWPFVTLLLITTSPLSTVNAAPHIRRLGSVHRHRATHGDPGSRPSGDGRTQRRTADNAVPVDVAGRLPQPSAAESIHPLFVQPSSNSTSSTSSNPLPAPTPTFGLLLKPPVVRKATRICTRRISTTTTLTATDQESTTAPATIDEPATTTQSSAEQAATTTQSTRDQSSSTAQATTDVQIIAAHTTTKTTSTTVKATSTAGALPSPFVAAYWAGWTADDLPPEKVNFDLFDIIDYAFAVPNSNFDLTFPDDGSETLLKRLVTAAHAKGKKVKLSVGGWTGSKYFSTAVSTTANRKTLANNMLKVYNKFNLDGIDIDWEYPGNEGQPGNIVSPSDSANFLSFLKLLRTTLPSGAYITAATQVWPFAGSNGAPMKDVSAFVPYLDWILLMNYDVWGSSSTPGPNAPLSDACKNSTQPLANAVAGVKSWTDAGMPASKITLGVPSYGYISKSKATVLTGRSSVVVQNDDGGTTDGQVSFNALISQGVLRKQDGSYAGSGGFTRHWDACSSTPYLTSSSAGQVITYDDMQSLELKAAFAKQAGIRGVNMFDAHGDTASGELVASLRQGLGLA